MIPPIPGTYMYEQPGEEVLLELEPYVGIRAWMVVEDTSGLTRLHTHTRKLLRSMHHPDVWQPGEPLHAECRSSPVAPMLRRIAGVALHEGPAPQLDCKCGVYAVKPDLQLLRHITLAEGAAVYGLVNLWGRIVEHTDGYRAQYARPLALWEAVDLVPEAVSDDTLRKRIEKLVGGQRYVDEVARLYDIPVVEWGNLEAR